VFRITAIFGSHGNSGNSLREIQVEIVEVCRAEQMNMVHLTPPPPFENFLLQTKAKVRQ
jgi:hypothetical protein